MSNKASIQILLATYNGAKYLPEQLQSLFDQTDQDFTILARDDGSIDGTVRLLKDFMTKHPGKLELIEDGQNTGSAKANFSVLLEASTAPYVMLCDQDDVWLPNKISLTREEMLKLEASSEGAVPVMVFTDLQVVDNQLNEMGASFWQYQNLRPIVATHFNRLLVQNVVTGCTVMCNRALVELALPVPKQAMMHDWWLALIASAFGRVGYVEQATIAYRQHSSNDTGAKHWLKELIFERRKVRAQHQRLGTDTYQQASRLLLRYFSKFSPDQVEMLTNYVTIRDRGYLMRRWVWYRHRFFRVGLLRNLHFLYRL